jgi:uncharacterized protein YfkK (UPF0435 family)
VIIRDLTRKVKWMRKFMIIAIPIVTLAIFVLIMLSGNYLKKPLGEEDNIPELVQLLTQNIYDEEWAAAAENTEKLRNVWNKITKRVQFSSERYEINGFSMNLARLRGAIMAKDKANSLSELYEAYEHWKELGN